VSTRLVCAYPKVAIYNGTGNPRETDSFTCRAPQQRADAVTATAP
jgi:hypothetical protein